MLGIADHVNKRRTNGTELSVVVTVRGGGGYYFVGFFSPNFFLLRKNVHFFSEDFESS